MVSTWIKKKPKLSYAERVLGAFSQIQREHKRHAVHVATIRAQVKKTAQERKDKLGPHWGQWVGKAINKLETDGILEPEKSTGHLTLTPNGKKAITTARRSLKLSTDSLSQGEDDTLWKFVVSQGPKRLLDDENPPSPKKRIRLQTGREKQQHDLLRGLSPLTDLDDEEELAKLRGELQERELEIAALRNELAGMKQREQEAENRTRLATPATTIHNHPGDLVRTQSGSFISRVSKHPTPAPSSPDRNAESDERLTDVDAMDLGHHEEDFVPPEGQDVAGLSEVEELRTQLKESAQQLLNKNDELDKQTKSLSDIQTELESLIREHGTLQEENSKLSTEMAGIEQAWKRTQEAAAKAHEELRGSESLINKLQDEATVTASRLSILETTNENLCRERDGLKEAIEQAKEAALRSESAKEDTETRMRQMGEKLATLERSDEEQKAKIDNLNARLGQVTTEARTLQERNVELETAVTASKLEVSEKTVSIANLGNVVEEKERQIKELSAQLHTAQVSADILNGQYAEAQSVIKTLSESLEAAQNTIGDYEARLETVDAQLKGERDLAEQLNEQLRTKASEVNDISERLEEAQRVTSKLEAELSDKNGTIQRMMNELQTARVVAENAEKALLDAEQRHVQEKTSLESQVSGLNTSMTIANTEIENVGARLSDVSLERDRLKVDMEMKTTEASQLNDLLRAERQEKSTLQAELQKSKDMYEDLEEELLDFKAAKTADERTITGLRKSFSNIRQNQQKFFEEIEGEISNAQPSPVAKTRRSTRKKVPV